MLKRAQLPLRVPTSASSRTSRATFFLVLHSSFPVTSELTRFGVYPRRGNSIVSDSFSGVAACSLVISVEKTREIILFKNHDVSAYSARSNSVPLHLSAPSTSTTTALCTRNYHKRRRGSLIGAIFASSNLQSRGPRRREVRLESWTITSTVEIVFVNRSTCFDSWSVIIAVKDS